MTSKLASTRQAWKEAMDVNLAPGKSPKFISALSIGSKGAYMGDTGLVYVDLKRGQYNIFDLQGNLLVLHEDIKCTKTALRDMEADMRDLPIGANVDSGLFGIFDAQFMLNAGLKTRMVRGVPICTGNIPSFKHSSKPPYILTPKHYGQSSDKLDLSKPVGICIDNRVGDSSFNIFMSKKRNAAMLSNMFIRAPL